MATSTTSIMPTLDLPTLARTTRKTIDRLAPFSNLHLSSNASESEPLQNPVLPKITAKVAHLLKSIDDSMLALQLCYRFATDSLVFCDLGIEAPHTVAKASPLVKDGLRQRIKEKVKVAVGVDANDENEEGWDIDLTIESLRERAKQGLELTQNVKKVWQDVSQDVYKIAAWTKDSTVEVVIPPDGTHAGTHLLTLHQVGTDLVANVSLLQQFFRGVSSVEEWWLWITEELRGERPACLYPLQTLSITPGPSDVQPNLSQQQTTAEAVEAEKTEGVDDTPYNVKAWGEMKASLQDYYDLIHPYQTRLPQFLAPSTKAWEEVATAMIRPPSLLSSTGHAANDKALDEEKKVESGGTARIFAFLRFGKGATGAARNHGTPKKEEQEEAGGNAKSQQGVDEAVEEKRKKSLWSTLLPCLSGKSVE